MPRPVLSSTSQWAIAARRQFTFYLRTYRFLGLVIFVAGVMAAVFALQAHAGVAAVKVSNADASAYLSGSLSSIGAPIILAAAFLGGDAIAIDFGTSSGYYMLVLPVKRLVLLAGRFAAAFLATVLIGLVYYAFSLTAAAYFYGPSSIPLAPLAASIGLAALFALAALAAAFLFSSFFRTPAVAMIVTVLILFLAFDIVSGVLELAGVEPWFSLLYSGDAVGQVFNTNFTHTTVIHAGGITVTTWEPYVWEGIVIMVGYLAACLGLSALIYERKESKG